MATTPLPSSGKIPDRIRHLQAEIDTIAKRMRDTEKDMAAREERMKRWKKEFGIID